jgi:hypothetical protein
VNLVYFGLLEDASRELLYQLLDVAGSDVDEVRAVPQPHDGLVRFVLGLDAAHDVFADHAADVAGRQSVIEPIER